MPIPVSDVFAGGLYAIYPGVNYEVLHRQDRNVHFQTWVDDKKQGQPTHMDIEAFAEKAQRLITEVEGPDVHNHHFDLRVQYRSREETEAAREALIRHVQALRGVGAVSYTG